tara:strand:- start:1486 stop:1668 length:183 start_codon:yes stop_codon:yes gene_type:complete
MNTQNKTIEITNPERLYLLRLLKEKRQWLYSHATNPPQLAFQRVFELEAKLDNNTKGQKP